MHSLKTTAEVADIVSQMMLDGELQGQIEITPSRTPRFKYIHFTNSSDAIFVKLKHC